MIAGISGGGSMRFILGLLIGILLTIIVTYVLDQKADGVAEKSMVNWDVVGEKVGALTSEAREVWNDFTREITGPP
jgi:uncharacterized membrane protein YdjX (TVP38/TMEM64 family)